MVTLDNFVVLLANVSAHNEMVAIGKLLLVHTIDSLLSSFGFLKVNITKLSEIAILALLDNSRHDLTEVGEEVLETLIIGTSWQSIDEQVSELLASGIVGVAIGALLVENNFHRLAFNFFAVERLSSLLSFAFFRVLDVAEATAGAIGEDLKLARFDLTEFLELFVHLLLWHILGKVANNNVGFLIEIPGVCLVQNNGSSTNDSVIHLLLALVSLLVRVESQVSIVLLV